MISALILILILCVIMGIAKRNFTLFVLSGISNRLINLMRLMYKHGYFPNEIVSDNFYDLLKIHRKLEDICKSLRETKTDQW